MAWKFDQVFVPDFSHFDHPVNFTALASSGCTAVIWKATQGGSYQDPTYVAARGKARQAGLLWGSFHFGDNSDVGQQIKNYLSFAAPAADDLISLDFEDYQDVSMSLTEAKEWIQGVETALGRENQAVLYSGNRIKEQLGSTKDPFWSAHRLWLAHYAQVPTWPPAWETYWLHQFTDGHNGPAPHTVEGVNGACDVNAYPFSEVQLKKEWAGAPVIVPPIPIAAKPIQVIIIAPPGVKVIVINDPRLA